ncbi:MAG: hypothetical protein KA352_11970 [Flavobacteriales bacterium]|nr:hypothetical protein [Flavobacteriales bacterium]
MNATNNRWPGVGLGFLLSCLLFAAAPRCEAQGNLVPNHSFEDADTCLGFLGFDYGPLLWFSGGGTPDYFQSCVPNGSANGVPQSVYAYQFSQDGEAHVGLVTFQMPEGWREYPMAQLLSPLVQGETYYVSFYVSAAWNGSLQNPALYLASSHIGVLFTMQPRLWTSNDPWPVAGNSAHVYYPWIVSDTVDWTLVSGSFVADSAYQYLIIGNHFDNAITDTLSFATFGWFPQAYTLIDNVCVSTNPLGCPLAIGVAEAASEDIVLFPNPAVHELIVRARTMDASAWVHDAYGRVVWQGRIIGDSWRLDVQAWARGSYMLRIAQHEQYRTFTFVLTE